MKTEIKRKEEGGERYRTGEQSLPERLRNKLLEATQWYKTQPEVIGEDIEEKREDRQRVWREWRKIKSKNKKKKKTLNGEEAMKRIEEARSDTLEGVMFLPHTENSVLAKRVREKLKMLEGFTRIRLRIVERAGEKLMDLLHKSNPWDKTLCGREDCKLCNGTDEKLWGTCKTRNIVYETECYTCKEKNEGGEEVRETEVSTIEVSQRKRKREVIMDKNKVKGEKESKVHRRNLTKRL